MSHRASAPLAILLVLGVAFPAFAQDTPRNLQDLVGARAPGGETQLQARGFANVGGQQGDDRTYTYWWNARTRQCISVATLEGRFQSITATPAPDCGRRPGSGNRPSTLPAYPVEPVYPPQARPSDGYAYYNNERVDLGLICYGDGRSAAAQVRPGYSWNDKRDRYEYTSRVELGADHAESTVQIQLWDGGGRIRLPRNLIPPIHSGGLGDGWWPLTDVDTRSNRITARYRTSGLNRPRVTVDRDTGFVSIDAGSLYGFRGTCNMIGGANHRRF